MRFECVSSIFNSGDLPDEEETLFCYVGGRNRWMQTLRVVLMFRPRMTEVAGFFFHEHSLQCCYFYSILFF